MSSRTCPTKEAALAERGLDEEDLIGEPLDDVPRIPPGDLCNGKTREGKLFDGYCLAYAGKQTSSDDGRCMFHGGADGVGAPAGNQNNQKHGLNADPRHYADNLDQDEEEWVRDMSAAIEDRIRANTGDIDPLDRTLARRLAIRLHIASQASEYVQTNGLIETIWTEDGRQDVPNRLLEELRQYDKDIVNDLKKIGVLDDPESQKADSLAQWKDFISLER